MIENSQSSKLLTKENPFYKESLEYLEENKGDNQLLNQKYSDFMLALGIDNRKKSNISMRKADENEKRDDSQLKIDKRGPNSSSGYGCHHKKSRKEDGENINSTSSAIELLINIDELWIFNFNEPLDGCNIDTQLKTTMRNEGRIVTDIKGLRSEIVDIIDKEIRRVIPNSSILKITIKKIVYLLQ